MSANRLTRFSVNPYAHDANSVAASVRMTAMPTIAASRRPSVMKTSATTDSVANSSFEIRSFRLVVRGLAVVARDGHFDASRNHRIGELREPLFDPLRDVDRVLAGLLRHGDRHRRIGAPRLGRVRGAGTADAVPRVVCRRRRAVDHARDVGEIDRLTVVDARRRVRERPSPIAGTRRSRPGPSGCRGRCCRREARCSRDCSARRDIGCGEAGRVQLVDVEQHLQRCGPARRSSSPRACPGRA